MSTITKTYAAPAWACSLWDTYKYFDCDGKIDVAYGIFRSGRLALEKQFGCSFEESAGFFHSEEPPELFDGFKVIYHG